MAEAAVAEAVMEAEPTAGAVKATAIPVVSRAVASEAAGTTAQRVASREMVAPRVAGTTVTETRAMVGAREGCSP